MFLKCNLTTSITRTTTDDYVRELTIDIRCFDADHAEHYLAGRIAASQVLWTDAMADGESLFEICDNDSQGLSDVFAALCDESGAVRAEFEIEDVFNHVLFVYQVVLHPEIKPYTKAILDVAVDLLGHEALIVMWRGIGGIPESDLAELGFRIVVRSELICRHSVFRSKFSQRFPRGQTVEIVGRPEFEPWVLEHWDATEEQR
jgi:hypothetical protein